MPKDQYFFMLGLSIKECLQKDGPKQIIGHNRDRGSKTIVSFGSKGGFTIECWEASYCNMYMWKIVDSKVATTKQEHIHLLGQRWTIAKFLGNNVLHCFSDAMIGQLCIHIQDLEYLKKWVCDSKILVYNTCTY